VSILRKIIKQIFKNKKTQDRIYLYYKYYRTFGIFKTLMFMIKDFFKKYRPKKNRNRSEKVSDLLKKVKIKNAVHNNFIYYIDPHKIPFSNKYIVENFTIDYEIVLKNSLNDMYKKNNTYYSINQNKIIDGISYYIDNIVEYLNKSDYDNKEKLIEYFENIKTKSASSFEEALQRILFYNQLIWQTGHVLVGLGRLDKILIDYYEKDIKNKIITEEEGKLLISDFLKTLHEYYWFKSNSLLGDTGQIIILGGIDKKGKYLNNKLTKIFIEELEKLQIPDPKILLRVSKNIPDNLLELSINSMKTGIGSPLFANDDVIIPKMIKFGYKEEDAYNYVTSACWEPQIASKGTEQNNVDSFIFMKPFNDLLDKENLSKINNIDELLEKYYKYLEKYTKEFIDNINKREYEEDLFISMFIDNCNKKEKDLTDGGVVYNYYGITTVSVGNVVNSILNINDFVFERKEYTLGDFNKIRVNNFKNEEELLNKLKNTKIRYGLDEDKVIKLSNDIMKKLSQILEPLRIKNGKIKIGFSAPSYITGAINQTASFDGRKNNDPFIVHISSDLMGLPYTSIFNFASKLDYNENRFNGNVVDFIVNPSFIDSNYKKFIEFLKLSINNGYFEMQMNVVSSKILIEAKNNPEKYPNLIVRVWGFSSYFNDLPEAYKDVLIKRAIESENKL